MRVHRGGEAWRQGAGCKGLASGQEQEAERSSSNPSIKGSKQEVGPAPPVTSAIKAHNLSQTAPPSGDLVFKHLSPRGTFSSKPSQWLDFFRMGSGWKMTPLKEGSTVHKVEIPMFIRHGLCGVGWVANFCELFWPLLYRRAPPSACQWLYEDSSWCSSHLGKESPLAVGLRQADAGWMEPSVAGPNLWVSA